MNYHIMWKPLPISHVCQRVGHMLRSLSTARLSHKSLLNVRGSLAAEFLQGLITNDMRSIERPRSFLYSFLLNVKGRIIADAFIYHMGDCDAEEPNYLIELDNDCAEYVSTYLSRYNIRKKVKITKDDSIAVWIAMPDPDALHSSLSNPQSWLPIAVPDSSSTCDIQRDLHFYAFDPRGVPGWSGRMLLCSKAEASHIFIGAKTDHNTLSRYNRARWRLGLPEGPKELLQNESLPLEANADLSGAVSFSKGCYVGQELTARTRFTGVVRRRFVPVTLIPIDGANSNSHIPVADNLLDLSSAKIYKESTVKTDNTQHSRPIGWLRAVNRHADKSSTDTLEGIALLRLTDVSDHQSDLRVQLLFTVNSDSSNSMLYQVYPQIPSWWPETIAPGLPRTDFG